MQRLPHQDKRVETGAVQFGEDWPGVFIRGDNAQHYAMALQRVLETGGDVIERETLKGLVNTLCTSRGRSAPNLEAITRVIEQVHEPCEARTAAAICGAAPRTQQPPPTTAVPVTWNDWRMRQAMRARVPSVAGDLLDDALSAALASMPPLYTHPPAASTGVVAYGCECHTGVHFVSIDRDECVEESHRDGSRVVELVLRPSASLAARKSAGGAG